MVSDSDQYGIPCDCIPSGTPKALFFHEKDIPARGPLRDAVLKRLMGTPDPLQIDEKCGSKHSTSKIAIVAPSKRDGVDIDFIFAQVSVGEDTSDTSVLITVHHTAIRA
jgi:2-methylaconitate cis-trans-isomerase PrpF